MAAIILIFLSIAAIYFIAFKILNRSVKKIIDYTWETKIFCGASYKSRVFYEESAGIKIPEKFMLAIRTKSKSRIIFRNKKAINFYSEFYSASKHQFSSEIKVETDNDELESVIKSDIYIQATLISIISYKNHGVIVERIEIDNSYIQLYFNVKNTFSEKDETDIVSDLLEKIINLKDFFDRSYLEKTKKEKYFLKKYSQINAFLITLFIVGLFNFFILRFKNNRFPQTMDWFELLVFALILGVVVITIIIFIVKKTLQGSQYKKSCMLVVFSFGFLGAFSSSVGLLRNINIYFDASRFKEIKIIDYKTYCGRKRARCFVDARELFNTYNWRRMEINSKQASLFHTPKNQYPVLNIVEYKGFLGLRWVSEIRVNLREKSQQ